MSIGMYGFRKNGIDKVTYFKAALKGGEPEVLGKAVLQYCQHNFAMDMVFDRIKMAEPNRVPTQRQFQWYIAAGYCDSSVLSEKPVWTRFMEKLSDVSDLAFFALVHGSVNMANYESCLLKGLFMYAYIINLDTGSLEFWLGRNMPPQENRYTPQEGLYGSSFRPYLAAEYPIKDIVAGGPLGIDGFIRQMQAAKERYNQ